MTRQEAGSKGGNRTLALHGAGHFAAISRGRKRRPRHHYKETRVGSPAASAENIIPFRRR